MSDGIKRNLEQEVSGQSDDYLVSVNNVGKCYRLYDKPEDRLKEQLFRRFGKQYSKEYWALRNINFKISKGETFGIIGRNGSGKSTLLQILANIMQPTEGSISVGGKVAALLELGSGFNPNYTGRENIFLNGAILGIDNVEMKKRIESITDFADIGEFIDQPVKTYSSGMFVRLAFSVATSVDADILLIDEALAVGDVFFRQKCYSRLEEMRKRGTSIILVSHAMGEIEQFCTRALLLDKGNQAFLGEVSEAVKLYYLLDQKERFALYSHTLDGGDHTELENKGTDSFSWPSNDAFFNINEVPEVSNGYAHCTAVGLCDISGNPRRVFEQGETASFYYEFELMHDIDVPVNGVVIYNDRNIIVHGKNNLQYDMSIPRKIPKNSRIRYKQQIQLNIQEGEYTFEVGLGTMNYDDYMNRSNTTHMDMESSVLRICHRPKVGNFCVLMKKIGKPTALQHHGICDLPGAIEVSIAE